MVKGAVRILSGGLGDALTKVPGVSKAYMQMRVGCGELVGRCAQLEGRKMKMR